MPEKKYLSGLYANKKHKNQRDFVICQLKVKPSVLIESLREHESMNGYLTLQVTTPYEEDPNWPEKLNVKIDDYQKDQGPKLTPPTAPVTPKLDEDFDDDLDLPF